MARSFLMAPALQTPHLNRLLAGLPTADRDFLLGAMRRERPPVGKVLARHSATGRDIWFPNDGVVALSTTDEDGQTAQTGVVGAEGCVGIEGLAEDAVTPSDAAVQIEGEMAAIPVQAMRAAINDRPAVRAALFKYLFRLSAQTMRLVACNRLHPLDRRCCTWLLMIQDRIGRDELPLTQDSLAGFLGGGRPRVNRTLGMLEGAGLVRRRRGHIKILARGALEQRACDCYRGVFRTMVSR